MKLNNIYNGDCTEILNKKIKNSIDLVFADPPYNLSGNALKCKEINWWRLVYGQ